MTIRNFLLHTTWGHIIIVFAVFFFFLLVVPGNNIFTWMAARREIRSQERQIRKYRSEIIEMKSRIDELSLNKDSLETYAREHFHFARPDEDVYLTE